jgi:hypothetical protein
VTHGEAASHEIAFWIESTVIFTVLRTTRLPTLTLICRVTTDCVGAPNSMSAPSVPRATTVLAKLTPGVAYAALPENMPARLATTTASAVAATTTAAVNLFISPPLVRPFRRASRDPLRTR